ncbi:MAG: hypothetical protein K0Q72_2402 [Armatimonadetes bacterium]|jgi:hypothetical protein|nr:hypothetical protein [Armatimonadota bacterium]
MGKSRKKQLQTWKPFWGYFLLALSASALFCERLRWTGGRLCCFPDREMPCGLLYAAAAFWLATGFYAYLALTDRKYR